MNQQLQPTGCARTYPYHILYRTLTGKHKSGSSAGGQDGRMARCAGGQKLFIHVILDPIENQILSQAENDTKTINDSRSGRE